MKLQNKITGRVLTKYTIRALEGVDADKGNEKIILIDDETNDKWTYYTIASFNDEWKDYEEPKETALEEIIRKLESDFKLYPDEWNNIEEAKQAVEKLKAWKRLRDKGLEFTGWNCPMGEMTFDIPKSFYDKEGLEGVEISDKTAADLDLLFGGEE